MSYRLALVTGATSGLGKEVCTLLAQKGISLMISGRDTEALDHLKKSLCSHVTTQTIPADLNTPEGRKSLTDALHTNVPDVVINNAGFGFYGDVLSYPTDEQLAILDVNGRAVLELSIEAARNMISNGIQGVILNVSSAAAFQVFPSMAVYAAAKAFVTQFSQAFDFETRPHGVRVLTICPGMIDTDFQRRAGGKRNGWKRGVMSPAFVAEEIWRQMIQLKRLKIVDWKYHLLTCLSSLLPISLKAPFNKRSIESRIKPKTLIKVNNESN